MRTGQNPSKTGIPAYEPKQLGVALLVYIPFLKGYFQHSLDILKYQIASLYEHTKQQFDLVIGNPPYIRYQYFDREQQQFASEIFAPIII